MRRGACLCGGVRFEVAGDLPDIQACHCRSCQKAQGAAFVAVLPIAKADLRFTAGEDLLAAFESSPGKQRLFCKVCGSPILSRAAALPDRVRLRAGAVEGPLGVKIASHAYTAEAVDWCAVAQDAPHYPGARPA
ncbi:MAG TPA: GFA family protein [Phenylobacterium sp.]|nr:GFA family protein [Phenylobacterium sp.]